MYSLDKFMLNLIIHGSTLHLTLSKVIETIEDDSCGVFSLAIYDLEEDAQKFQEMWNEFIFQEFEGESLKEGWDDILQDIIQDVFAGFLSAVSSLKMYRYRVDLLRELCDTPLKFHDELPLYLGGTAAVKVKLLEVQTHIREILKTTTRLGDEINETRK